MWEVTQIKLKEQELDTKKYLFIEDKNEVEKVFYIPFNQLKTAQNWQPLTFVRHNKPRVLQGFYSEVHRPKTVNT